MVNQSIVFFDHETENIVKVLGSKAIVKRT